MKIGMFIFVLSGVVVSCVSTRTDNSIVEFPALNKAIVKMDESSLPGEKLIFFRVDCASINSKRRKCMHVPVGEGIIKKSMEKGLYEVEIQPGGHIEASAIVKKDKSTDRK